jgi:hypothetical protein
MEIWEKWMDYPGLELEVSLLLFLAIADSFLWANSALIPLSNYWKLPKLIWVSLVPRRNRVSY